MKGENPWDPNHDTVSGLLFTLLSLVAFKAVGSYMIKVILGVVGVCVLASSAAKLYNRNLNLFLGSGRKPPARYSRELLLKQRGGKGDGYFCDPSVAFGSLTDFDFVEGRKIDFKQLLQEKGETIGPYCVDDESRSVVFVETDGDIDPAEVGPFYFQSQRDHAIRLYTVPYEEYHRVISALDEKLSCTKDLLLVYNVSRCGSTLLSKCLDNLKQFRSISEPDIMTSLTHMASEAQGSRDDDIIALCHSSAKLLCYLRRRRYPDCESVCIKFRFQMVYISDLVHKALPEAKAIFLYRNALDVVDSMGAAFINTGFYRAVRIIGLDVLYVYYLSTLPQHLWKLMPLMKDRLRFPPHCYMWLGAVSPFVLSWLSTMHYAMIAHGKGHVLALIRYEDLIRGRTELVAKMLQTLGMLPACHQIDPSQKTDLTKVFLTDAHANHSTFSRRTVFDESSGRTVRKGYAYLRGRDADMVQGVIRRHEVIQRSDYVIPGTLTC